MIVRTMSGLAAVADTLPGLEMSVWWHGLMAVATRRQDIVARMSVETVKPTGLPLE